MFQFFFQLGTNSSVYCFPFKLYLSFFVSDSPLSHPGFRNSPIWDLFFTYLLAWIFIQRITYIWALISDTFIRCVGWLEVLSSCYGKSQVLLVLSRSHFHRMEGVWFHTWTSVTFLPCLVSVCQHLFQCRHTSTRA